MTNRILGYALDIESVRRSIRARAALVVLFVLTMGKLVAVLSVYLSLSDL